ncbi:ABC transporter substrate-binding protein [Microvirga sp. KLBC 81]|uniref:TRAP transporter substrate-binding protein n=1 Tax=Microvirga sp. KLBC 81 TaxID=1862707 RepID=UPI000D50F514|nr:TRAP transporter substrate-binding protein [Microvirga sp. KLBC 81]PVE23594.1 ABC transporter substrate-binding protein [Microvirga sp. KLBC 81]
MPTGPKLSRRITLGIGVAALAAPTAVRAQTLRWRMVTSWPKGRTGPGISAQRIVERINAMSGGRLQIDLFAAGEIVPPFAVLDAVSNGTVEMGHTASLYWQGRMPAAGFFTSVPFGLGPIEHQAWIELRGGQALWDELYAPHGVRAFLAGNTGPSMGGWFRRRLNGVEDLKGMRLRVQGLGAEIYAKLGAVPMTVSAGDLLPSLEKGSIDAAEFLAPATDLETGLPKYASFYYAPGFNKPNGASELLISLAAWDRLTPDLQRVIMEACRAEHTLGLADAYQTNAVALTEILGKYPVSLEAFPRSIMDAAQTASVELLSEIASTSALAGRMVESYRSAQRDLRSWSALAADMARANTRASSAAR